MNKRNKALLLMCLLVCFWGLDYVFAKEALDILQPMSLLFLKYSVGFMVLLAIKLKADRKAIVRLKDIPWFILCSLTGEILYFFCEYSAMDYIPVSLITIILSFVPAVSIIIDRILYKKKASPKMLVGVMACIVGVIIVIGADFKVLLEGRILGYLLAFGAVISWNCYNFITAKVSENYNSATMSFTQLTCTVLMVMPYALHHMPPIDSFTPGVIGGIIYLGCVSAGVGFFILVYGLKVLGPTISAMFSNFLPVTATIFGWLFLGETIGMMQFAGGALVIASSCVVIAEKGKMEEQSNDREAEPDNADGLL
ncbi:MAG: DMT family transporter [Clostridiales bacterium]|nr:DMT family transporter [Clostridiales bacterium]